MPSSSSSDPAAAPRGPSPALALGLALALTVGGCTVAERWVRSGAAAPPPAPPARTPFDHRFHLERGPACLDCHEGADSAEKAAMPKPETCLECHGDIDGPKPREKTVAAFLDEKGAPRWSAVTAQGPDVIFSHAAHARAGVDCASCHRGIEQSTAVTSELRQDMAACVTCHEEKKAPGDCATCHRAAAEGVAAGRGPWWRPANHDAIWRGDHGGVARRGAPAGPAERCADCHGQPGFPEAANCETCHAANRPADHAALWRVVHGQEVRRDPGIVAERCVTCHERSSCLGCHAVEPPADHTRAWCTGGGHGIASAMDRGRCVACHQPDSCAECHDRVAPRNHRAGWGSPRNRHCVSCHLPIGSDGASGCATCHRGTPSHAAAPRMPSAPPHRPDAQCRACHGPTMRHADDGSACVRCHR